MDMTAHQYKHMDGWDQMLNKDQGGGCGCLLGGKEKNVKILTWTHYGGEAEGRSFLKILVYGFDN